MRATSPSVLAILFAIFVTPHVAGCGGPTDQAAPPPSRGGPPTPGGPWWNTWITDKGTSESQALTSLQPKGTYDFYVDLSALQRAAVAAGARSKPADEAFAKGLEDGFRRGIQEKTYTFRFEIVGRSVEVTDDLQNVDRWQNGRWEPVREAGMAIPASFELRPLFDTAFQDGDPSTALQRARAGGIRFGITAVADGCAAIAISIWDGAGKVPLDHAAHVVTVGPASGPPCDPLPDVRHVGPAILVPAAERNVADAAFASFEFQLRGKPVAASFLVFRNPESTCPFYSWSSDATVAGAVLKNDRFKELLVTAHRPHGSYASVAELLASAVFPSGEGGRCGASAARQALAALSEKQAVALYARVTDAEGALQVAPMGLLAMSRRRDGSLEFAHEIKALAPLARETLDATGCVSAWTFMLPPTLKGLGDVATPAWTKVDQNVVRTKREFQSQFLDAPDTDDPTGLLLLAHHQQGVLTFSDDTENLSFADFRRTLGKGSIAVLSACESASLDENSRLIDRLNRQNVDAIIASPFVIDSAFGMDFAVSFATTIHTLKQPTMVQHAFDTALGRTRQRFVRLTDPERARGLALELVLVGNPTLSICPPARPARGKTPHPRAGQ